MSIFELVTSEQIVAYWEIRLNQLEALLGDELFPADKKLGLDLKWIKGSKGLPIVLKPSAFDVAAVKRPRIGFDKVQTQMPFFKESMMVDEEMRQQLNMVLETGNQAYIDSIMNRVFDDEMQLLTGARAQRERMKMMLLTTGIISISANGQDYDYDYGMEDVQKVDASIPWSDPDSTIVDDIRRWMKDMYKRTGQRPQRAVMTLSTFEYFMNNTLIRNAILGNDTAVPVMEEQVVSYILRAVKLNVAIYDQMVMDEHGNEVQLVPDDLFVMFPSGPLGTGWFGTTPEESDLMTGSAANVTITDLGVAVTTSKKIDPVNVDTKVSMIFLPSFEQIDKVIIASVA